MESTSQESNPFTGKWRIISLYCNVVDQGWTLFKRYGSKSFVWEFCEIGSVRFPSGSVLHSGVLHEVRPKHKAETTEYSYCSADRQLYIDRSDYEPDGFVNICINDCYRVERVTETEYWLYDLEDVEKEPEDYRFRIKIKKL
jgi:hypothetical protein